MYKTFKLDYDSVHRDNNYILMNGNESDEDLMRLAVTRSPSMMLELPLIIIFMNNEIIPDQMVVCK